MKKEIWDYFSDEIEFPKEVAHDPIPYGTIYQYISATFLNGFINYVEPIATFVIDRYEPRDKKIEMIEAIRSGEEKIRHTKLDMFEDDVIVLGRIPTETTKNDVNRRYMFFWFDKDVSDCFIGRFITDDPEEEVIRSVRDWLERERKEAKEKGLEPKEFTESGITDYHELQPDKFIKGWVKF